MGWTSATDELSEPGHCVHGCRPRLIVVAERATGKVRDGCPNSHVLGVPTELLKSEASVRSGEDIDASAPVGGLMACHHRPGSVEPSRHPSRVCRQSDGGMGGRSDRSMPPAGSALPVASGQIAILHDRGGDGGGRTTRRSMGRRIKGRTGWASVAVIILGLVLSNCGGVSSHTPGTVSYACKPGSTSVERVDGQLYRRWSSTCGPVPPPKPERSP